MAHRQSAAGTFAQSIGRMPLLIRNMRPTWSLPSLAALDAEFVSRHDIGGLIWDVDGTLTAYHLRDLHPGAETPFRALLALPGVRHAILSNADERRCAELASLFPELPVVRLYRNGETLVPRVLLGSTDSWTPEQHATMAAAGAVAIRKPSGPLVLEAARAIGCEPARAVMVGDQYLTDVAGANLGGVRSVKLPTCGRETFPGAIKLSQLAERAIFAVCHGRQPGEQTRPA